MNQGVDLRLLWERFAQANNCSELEAKLKTFELEGLLQSNGSYYQLTHRGRLLCDLIGSALLEV
jgi:coproporphyrinogen III oxidase-like Fe-S oxidoreductase